MEEKEWAPDCNNPQRLLEEVEDIMQFHSRRLIEEVEKIKEEEEPVSRILVEIAECLRHWVFDLEVGIDPYLRECEHDSVVYNFAQVNAMFCKYIGDASFVIRPVGKEGE